MNIIRTKAVELSSIPAIAFKLKLSSGGAGLKLIRLDCETTAVATIDKRSGEAVIEPRTDMGLFPAEAFCEAIELTCGLPYSSRGKISVHVSEKLETEEVGEEAPEKIDMVDSDEYKAITDRYSDEKGKMNYSLMNKDFIQFASKSKTVADMVAANASPDEIVAFVVKSRATFITGKKESLPDPMVTALINTLDEIDPRSAFKELKAHIKRMMARR
ncbi:MAG: hypothetical protein FWE68_06455 [Defluviitaleaceae bacterium]|nr:hypothetical protein [Defluviitaleaceae bacterium]